LLIALGVGLFTGIQRFNEARRIAANGPQRLAELDQLQQQQRISGYQGQ
jgi:hypothetical protein